MIEIIFKNVSKLSKRDWVEYIFLAGIIFLVSCYIMYLYFGSLYYGANLPGYLFAVAIGFFIGGIAYLLDSFSHKTLKYMVPKLEHIVHYFVLFGATIPLWISFILAFWFGITMLPFSIVFFFLQVYYTLYDEITFHWKRGYVAEQVIHWLIIWGPGSAQIAFFYWAYVDKFLGLDQILRLLGF